MLMLIVATIINSLLLTLAVLTHYEALRMLSMVIPKESNKRYLHILLVFFVIIIAHIIEIWLFALGYYFMNNTGMGSLEGNFYGTLLDCGYFSFTSYTSLGYGDVYPLGYLRYLSGLEALTGLLMIAWTASFMFIEMQKFWHIKK